MAFLTDDELPRDPAQRRQQVLAGLARLFGSRAKSPRAYFETDWSSDGWSAGCVSPLPRKILSRFGPACGRRLTASIGRGRRRPRSGADTWRVPCARENASPPRSWRHSVEMLDKSLQCGSMACSVWISSAIKLQRSTSAPAKLISPDACPILVRPSILEDERNGFKGHAAREQIYLGEVDLDRSYFANYTIRRRCEEHRMRVISKARLKDFWESPGREDADGPLRAWYTHVNSKRFSWQTWRDVKASFAKASIVGDCVVFNIGGNKYRLISRIRYATQKVFVLKVMTHGEYDDGTWKHECGCFEVPASPNKKKAPPTHGPRGGK